jgi:hypothetical protein
MLARAIRQIRTPQNLFVEKFYRAARGHFAAARGNRPIQMPLTP